LLLAGALAGCATHQADICIPKGTFALLYADVSRPIYQACAEGRLTPHECEAYRELNRRVRTALSQPKPQEENWGHILTEILKLLR
jgi:hypothetical protein